METRLFSLEIYIDRIRLIDSERCFFPSTILKFLGYEPQILSSTNKKIKDYLKEHIDKENEKFSSVTQIDQLKDQQGNFTVRKGKSILFECDVVDLIGQLHSIPLYILLVDDYYEPYHLVGVVSIDLSSCIRKLSEKINCYSSNSVSEELGGKMSITDLIGRVIGSMSCRLRILCIGDNLAQHIDVDKQIDIRPRRQNIESKDEYVETFHEEINQNNDCAKSKPFVAMKSVGIQAITNTYKVRIQTQTQISKNISERLSKIGLTIDPYDPLLEAPPPLIYNSSYPQHDYSEDEDNGDYEIPCNSQLDSGLNFSAKPHIDKSNYPILNNLFKELQNLKNGNQIKNQPDISVKPISDVASEKIPIKNLTTKSFSKSIMKTPSTDKKPSNNSSEKPSTVKENENHENFLLRISRPKSRPKSPEGIVPKETSWLRSEPNYSGPEKSNLQFKFTKSQLKRMEYNKNQIMKHKNKKRKHKSSVPVQTNISPTLSQTPSPRKPRSLSIPNSDQQNPTKQPKHPTKHHKHSHKPTSSDYSESDYSNQSTLSSSSSSSHKPRINKFRVPLSVPPLFNPGTSFSNPTASQDSIHADNTSSYSYQRPPLSPTKDRSHINNSLPNLNPVKSTRSPKMTIRSNSRLDISESCNDDRVADNDDDQALDSTVGSDRKYSSNHNNKNPPMEYYSDDEDFTSDIHTSLINSRSGRKQTNLSQISMTSQWQTEYSQRTSFQSNDDMNDEVKDNPDYRPSNIKSPDQAAIISPPRNSYKQRRKFKNSGSLFPGGRQSSDLATNSTSNSMMTFDQFKASYDIDASASSSQEYHQHSKSNDDSLARPSSIGGDLTSFTKVTKYEKSSGYLPNNSHYQQRITNLNSGTSGNLGSGTVPTSNLMSISTNQSLELSDNNNINRQHNNNNNKDHHYNHLNNNNLVGSMRSDDSQYLLTSGSYNHIL